MSKEMTREQIIDAIWDIEIQPNIDKMIINMANKAAETLNVPVEKVRAEMQAAAEDSGSVAAARDMFREKIGGSNSETGEPYMTTGALEVVERFLSSAIGRKWTELRNSAGDAVRTSLISGNAASDNMNVVRETLITVITDVVMSALPDLSPSEAVTRIAQAIGDNPTAASLITGGGPKKLDRDVSLTRVVTRQRKIWPTSSGDY
jgi:hypothetical protein